MKTSNNFWLWAISSGAGYTYGQSLDPNICIGPLTTASNCDFYNSRLEACNSLRGSAAVECWCPQTILDAIAGCKSEFRLCIQGNDYDAAFDGSQGFFGLWHSACDGNLTYSPTTSSLSPLATTFGGADCLTAESDCNVLSAATSTCSGQYQNAGDVKSCMCAASVLEIASLCDFGAGRCLGEPPNSTNLFSYHFCREGQGPVTFTTKGTETLSSTRIVLTRSPGNTSTPPASPGSIPSAVSTSTSGGATRGVPCIGIWTVLSLTVWFLV